MAEITYRGKRMLYNQSTGTFSDPETWKSIQLPATNHGLAHLLYETFVGPVPSDMIVRLKYPDARYRLNNIILVNTKLR